MRLACYLMFPRAAGDEGPKPVNESEHPQRAPAKAAALPAAASNVSTHAKQTTEAAQASKCATLSAGRRRSPAHAQKRRSRAYA